VSASPVCELRGKRRGSRWLIMLTVLMRRDFMTRSCLKRTPPFGALWLELTPPSRQQDCKTVTAYFTSLQSTLRSSRHGAGCFCRVCLCRVFRFGWRAACLPAQKRKSPPVAGFGAATQ
jgi:hypothetical protein